MVRVGVIGASGYTGLELIKILLSHPAMQLTYLANTEGDIALEALHPNLKGVATLPVEKADADEVARRCELAFLALPHKSAMQFAKALLERGLKVVDLSADYRLQKATYEAHYCPHEDPEHLGEAVYGLPEYQREQIKTARLIANPGCYPTASLLGILPFADFIAPDSPVFIDAKSGVSGAGKKCTPTTHFTTVNDNFFAYNPLAHRHAPEIAEKIELLGGKKVRLCFVPHLLPLTRGMLVSIYFTPTKPIDPLSHLKTHYADEPWIRVYDAPVSLKQCAGTHFADLFAMTHEGQIYVNVAIDNLLRGASSQAVANANLLCGLEESLALPRMAYVP